VIDIAAESATRLDVPPTSLPFPPLAVDGSLYVHREDPEAGTSTLYRVDGTTAVAGPTVTGEILQLGRIR